MKIDMSMMFAKDNTIEGACPKCWESANAPNNTTVQWQVSSGPPARSFIMTPFVIKLKMQVVLPFLRTRLPALWPGKYGFWGQKPGAGGSYTCVVFGN